MLTKKIDITKTKRKAPKPKMVKGKRVQRPAQPYRVTMPGKGKASREEYYVSARTAALGAVRMLKAWVRADHLNRRVRIGLPDGTYRFGYIQNVGLVLPKEVIILDPIVKPKKK